MQTITFSHRYDKMPTNAALSHSTTYLSLVLVVQREELSERFVAYDTAYDGGNYPLPKGKLLLLCLVTANLLWTTVRRWTPRKEAYYRSLVGQPVRIEIAELAAATK